MNFDEFDKKLNAEQFQKDLAEAKAAANDTDYPEIPKGDYDVKIERMEIKLTKTNPAPMFSVMLRIQDGQFKNACLFFNRKIANNKVSDKWNDAKAVQTVISKNILDNLKKDGYSRIRINNEEYELNEEIDLEKTKKHNIDVVIDRLIIKEDIRSRLYEAIETSTKLSTKLSLKLHTTNCKSSVLDIALKDSIYSSYSKGTFTTPKLDNTEVCPLLPKLEKNLKQKSFIKLGIILININFSINI